MDIGMVDVLLLVAIIILFILYREILGTRVGFFGRKRPISQKKEEVVFCEEDFAKLPKSFAMCDESKDFFDFLKKKNLLQTSIVSFFDNISSLILEIVYSSCQGNIKDIANKISPELKKKLQEEVDKIKENGLTRDIDVVKVGILSVKNVKKDKKREISFTCEVNMEVFDRFLDKKGEFVSGNDYSSRISKTLWDFNGEIDLQKNQVTWIVSDIKKKE